ncbi:acidocalcisomal exopolyphosphatase [Trypanosoma rangeli SC58]|uniref:Acidocalcisomal exopolyphosphatase n=1 Tax=Trypanosoma rangeli SC58 TaxID=429131 RepID=A0A061IV86_TRYRA|nr:acidocalcisomal exopolyphosphatase [Trypanosoma rangeli SC58]
MSAVINNFLRRCAELYAARKPFVLVLGNEGGDMDSIIGAMYLAFYLQNHSDLGGGNYAPALNFEKEDFPLRRDVAQLLLKHGIATEWLLSVKGTPGMADFVDLQAIQMDIVLYDHNKLIPEQSFLRNNVVGVIDHHFDEKLYLDKSSHFRKIETVGSACTLVAELFRTARLTIPCPELLLAPIVLDTVNFNPAQKKVTAKDIDLSQWLLKQASEPIELTNMFFELTTWKHDILGLTFPQHFRRDYKMFECSFKRYTEKTLQIGISSISCRFDQLLGSHGMPELASSCLEFLASKNLDAFLLAFAGERGSGNHCRQLAFIAKGTICEALKEFAEHSPEGVVFTPIDSTQQNEWELICYELSDASVSRKRLAPSLLMFLTSWQKL